MRKVAPKNFLKREDSGDKKRILWSEQSYYNPLPDPEWSIAIGNPPRPWTDRQYQIQLLPGLLRDILLWLFSAKLLDNHRIKTWRSWHSKAFDFTPLLSFSVREWEEASQVFMQIYGDYLGFRLWLTISHMMAGQDVTWNKILHHGPNITNLYVWVPNSKEGYLYILDEDKVKWESQKYFRRQIEKRLNGGLQKYYRPKEKAMTRIFFCHGSRKPPTHDPAFRGVHWLATWGIKHKPRWPSKRKNGRRKEI